jgi:D-tyrosyl-tRNA(Tyr) deacylase|tara:strand:- start:57 stop:560 length:504 start_codon:yes stop_codon:yes gene_type:complete
MESNLAQIFLVHELMEMRAVVQRVSSAAVAADGEPKDAIGRGLLIFLGVAESDEPEDLEWLVRKIPQIRCFEDTEGRMNRSVVDIEGELMVISQFTLFGNLKKGSRPSFNRAARPEKAIPMYEEFVTKLEAAVGRRVATGSFGAQMDIEAQNDGPVTLILDTEQKDF